MLSARQCFRHQQKLLCDIILADRLKALLQIQDVPSCYLHRGQFRCRLFHNGAFEQQKRVQTRQHKPLQLLQRHRLNGPATFHRLQPIHSATVVQQHSTGDEEESVSKPPPTDAGSCSTDPQDRQRLRERLNLLSHKRTKDANKVVKVALGMNFIDFCVKAGTAYITGSKALMAESIHSLMDMLNQASLYIGNKKSMEKPNPRYPYGFGNIRYVSSLIAGCAIFGFGGGLSIYSGAHGLLQWYAGAATELESLPLACMMLFGSAALQSISFLRARHEIVKHAQKEGVEFSTYVKSVDMDPSLKVVYQEDLASLRGVLFAFVAVFSTHMTGCQAFDSLGSICIGLLLANAARTIIATNAMLLFHRSLPDKKIHDIVAIMMQDPSVKKVGDVKATYISPIEVIFKAEVDYYGREVTRAYLRQQCDLTQMLKDVQAMKSEKELEEFMLKHGDKIVESVGDRVDVLEQRVQERHPEVRHVDLEQM